ncbi:HD domain-containing protein [Dubosiella newyorkensis]|jgi:putative hydrolase of HD superfamily|uniref:Hydrolase n=1 Tax=Dubosiella newyorkensis TaxID=1862672 RepID=A0A1U7NPB8_9FIRM|nr:HD domain-containing protein [Dubosiella newyorkensis]MCI9040425.1 HD domain-containing protein [Dubosiella newyorkensis]OLU47482.1 hydrolase [Dubosiella newyorkensis]
MSRLQKQIDFCQEIDQEKGIERKTLTLKGERFENDAEHAWHAALMAILLQEHANEEIDLLKTVTMLLIHDLVEIDAGDTYAYDEKGQENHYEKEYKAAKRIYGLLPEDQRKYLMGLWEEFEAQKTPEARFARTIDNFQPTMLNHASKGEMWKRNQIKLSQVLKRNEPSKRGSQVLWDYSYQNFIEPHLNQELEDDTKKSD